MMPSLFRYVLVGFPNITEMFVNGLKAFFGMIAGALNAVATWFVQLCIVFLTDTPAPVSDSGSFTDNPGRIFMGCQEFVSGGYNCTAPWNASYEVYTMAKEYGIIFLVIGIIFSQISQPIQQMRNGRTDGSEKILERSILGIIGIELWWVVGSFVLELASGLASGLGSIAMSNYTTVLGGVGGGSLAVILVGIVVYTVSVSTLLIVLIFWVLRYVAIFMLMGIMPIIIGLWAFQVGPLEQISSRAKEIGELFAPLAFASVPAAVVLWAGAFFLKMGSSFASGAITSSTTSVGGSVLTLLTSITMFILGALMPVLAGLAPLAFFRDSGVARKYDPSNIKQYAKGAQDRVETARERHSTAKRQGAAARAAYQGQGPIAFEEDENGNMVATQTDSWSEAAGGSRAMHSLMSGGSKGKEMAKTSSQVAKRSADVAGAAVFNPRDAAVAGGVMADSAARDTKSSLDTTINNTKDKMNETTQQLKNSALDTAAKGYMTGVQAQEWKEDRQNLSSQEVLSEMEAGATGVSSAAGAAGGAVGSAGGSARKAAFESDVDVTNPRIVDDDGNPVKTPDGFDQDYVTKDMVDRFKTDSEGNIITDSKGIAQTPDPETPDYITSQSGQKLTNDRGQPVKESEGYKYERDSNGNFVLEDETPVPKEAVRDGPDSEPLRAESSDDEPGEWVTPSRVQRGEYMTTSDFDESIPDDRKVKVTVMTETGPTTKTVIKDEEGNIMKREKHRFEQGDD